MSRYYSDIETRITMVMNERADINLRFENMFLRLK